MLTLASACGDEGLPPYRPPPSDARDGGGRTMPIGSNAVTDENIDRLIEIGADLRDPHKICSGWDHSCAIDKDGKVWCWPAGNIVTNVPPDLPPQQVVTCGVAHVCVLDEAGVARCWGYGTDPTTPPDDHVSQGQSIVPDGRYKEIAAGMGGIHTCAIDMDDDLVCWGAGDADKTAMAWANFGQARPPAGKFKSVVAGEAHSCAIKLQNGEVVCWGGEGDGRCFPPLGYACGQLNTPLGSYEQLAAGAGHVCALDASGGVRCWGAGTSEEPCDPYDDISLKQCGQSIPPSDVEVPFATIWAGSHTTCAITEEYEAHCWGWNQFGQASVRPGAYAQIAPGDLHTCAIGVNGMPVCWGDSGGKTRVPADFPDPADE